MLLSRHKVMRKQTLHCQSSPPFRNTSSLRDRMKVSDFEMRENNSSKRSNETILPKWMNQFATEYSSVSDCFSAKRTTAHVQELSSDFDSDLKQEQDEEWNVPWKRAQTSREWFTIIETLLMYIIRAVCIICFYILNIVTRKGSKTDLFSTATTDNTSVDRDSKKHQICGLDDFTPLAAESGQQFLESGNVNYCDRELGQRNQTQMRGLKQWNHSYAGRTHTGEQALGVRIGTTTNVSGRHQVLKNEGKLFTDSGIQGTEYCARSSNEILSGETGVMCTTEGTEGGVMRTKAQALFPYVEEAYEAKKSEMDTTANCTKGLKRRHGNTGTPPEHLQSCKKAFLEETRKNNGAQLFHEDQCQKGETSRSFNRHSGKSSMMRRKSGKVANSNVLCKVCKPCKGDKSVVHQCFIPDVLRLEDQNPSWVVFDLETTSLARDSDIIQISAVCGTKHFNTYVIPEKPITTMASQITGITNTAWGLMVYGTPVHGVSQHQAMTAFLAFVQSLNKPILIGHNVKQFDYPILLNKMKYFRMSKEFLSSVLGFVDTLHVFKDVVPKDQIQNYKQTSIVQHFLNLSYSAHDSLSDVRSLQDVLCLPYVQALFSIKDYVFSPYFHTCKESLQVLSDNKICNHILVNEMASLGICLAHLKMAAEENTLSEFLQEHCYGSTSLRSVTSNSVLTDLKMFFMQDKCFLQYVHSNISL